jgi:hypothetical protein
MAILYSAEEHQQVLEDEVIRIIFKPKGADVSEESLFLTLDLNAVF